ncbi:MAG TPA: hypothetical protein VIV66_01805, partial [Pyrinomonadaceae bacterium]
MNPALKSKLGNYWVFREGRKRVNGPAFLREVLDSVSQITGRPASDDTILGALVIAGELESALADVGSSSLAAAEAITDYLADRLVGREATSEEVLVLRLAISQITVPEHLSVSPPEGFAYYALHPSDFANLAKQAA